MMKAMMQQLTRIMKKEQLVLKPKHRLKVAAVVADVVPDKAQAVVLVQAVADLAVQPVVVDSVVVHPVVQAAVRVVDLAVAEDNSLIN
jgi:hypothetical protein